MGSAAAATGWQPFPTGPTCVRLTPRGAMMVPLPYIFIMGRRPQLFNLQQYEEIFFYHGCLRIGRNHDVMSE